MDLTIHSYSKDQRLKAVCCSVCVSVAVVWFGHMIGELNDLSYLQAAAFILAAKDIAIFASHKLNKYVSGQLVNQLLSHAVGGLIAFTASYLGTCFYLSDYPVPLFSAVALTIFSFAMTFFSLLMITIKFMAL